MMKDSIIVLSLTNNLQIIHTLLQSEKQEMYIHMKRIDNLTKKHNGIMIL
jgi:hypothetical protein